MLKVFMLGEKSIFLKMAEELLIDFDCEVTVSEFWEENLVHELRSFDVVFLEYYIQNGRVSGGDVCKKLKKNGLEMPIYIISSIDKKIVDFKKYLADGYIEKEAGAYENFIEIVGCMKRRMVLA